MDEDVRTRALRRWEALKAERATWVPHWREIAELMHPRAGRLLDEVSQTNKGERRDQHILDNTAVRALRTLGSGLMAGMTSPARPWFRLTTSDPELDESAAVKQWLHDVQQLLGMVFARSNTYLALHSCYEELGAFGTCASVVVDDFNAVMAYHPMTVGQYALACGNGRTVDTLYREFAMTAEQLVREFGRDKCSLTVRRLYDDRRYDTWMPVVHAIEPRHERDAGKRDSQNMAWRSVYLEPGGEAGKVLREGGFNDFPALCARWRVYGSDIYGASPAMDALGDAKQLQLQQKRKAQAIDYMTLPPLQAPNSLKNQRANMLPGGLTYVDAPGAHQAVRSLFEVRLDLNHLLADMQDVRGRIDSAFYADLFLMLTSREKDPRMTATEVAERHEEKLLMLGPVLERLHGEILSPVIELGFAKMLAAGIVPPAPEELQGRRLNVEFVSVLAQAQRAIAVNSIDRFVMTLGQVAQVKPDVLDKLDADYMADAVADMLGIDPKLVVPGERVALIRQQRAEQQAAMQQAAMAEQAAGAAAKLGSVNTAEPNALTDLLGAG